MTKVKEERLWDERFIEIMGKLAPGTPLREGLESIQRGKMGALVLINDNKGAMELVDGGFVINAEFTPAGIYELAKMDGAIVLSEDGKKILVANAQLVPEYTITTSETGTRHRTAQRVARQTGALVIAISHRRNIITVYLGNRRYILSEISTLLNRAHQALQTLEKYRIVLNKGLSTLIALEFEDLVTLGDVISLLIRAEHVSRIVQEVKRYIVELGTEGRLVSMQLEELEVEKDIVEVLLKDYALLEENQTACLLRKQIAELPEDHLEATVLGRLLGYSVTANALDLPMVPRGYRILAHIPRLPQLVIQNLVQHFNTLPRIAGATIQDLDDVDGIGESRAKMIKDGLKRVREQALWERHS
ncbi:MAG: DNA integrity scanning diadenylate cyclase DisA [Sporomusaceae bacterium]|nr:DNA integrity scanning diadenylate cyclase DisA [Sporomusaceae bacterium]